MAEPLNFSLGRTRLCIPFIRPDAARAGRYIGIMRFTPEFLDEIKTRVTLSDVVGRHVRLRKQGREWRGLSPFNAEKTPSFYVNDDKMAWFDFSSHRNGNVFDFLMATEGLTFPEAVERLAEEAGLDLPKASPESVAREIQRAGLVEVLEFAAQFFERNLNDRAGTAARAYLAGRGLSAELQRDFRLGYASAERFALRDHLAGKGASAEIMIEAGLLVHGEGIAVPYDRFRDRVMFPIADRSGRIIAFGGRALDPTAPAKYLNSPETPLFHKGGVLYNHHKARKAASERGTVIAVEGYVDAIAMTGAGFPHVVAPLGTALTADQCELLWRMGPEPILCFDGDGAGRRAAFKAVETVLPFVGPSKTMRFAFLPEGQDPDDLARTAGPGAISEVIDKARPLVDVLWIRETENAPLDTPEHRAGLEHRLNDLVRTIADEPLRRYYLAEIRSRLNALTGWKAPSRPATAAYQAKRPDRAGRGFGSQPLRGYIASALPPLSESLSKSPHFSPGAFARRDVEILVALLNHPALLQHHAEDLAHLDFGNPDLKRLGNLLVDVSSELFENHEALKKAIDARGYRELRVKIETIAAKLPYWYLRPETADSDADQALRQALALHRKTRELHRELKEAELAFGCDGSDTHFSWLRDVQSRLTALEGTEATIEGYGMVSGHKLPDV